MTHQPSNGSGTADQLPDQLLDDLDATVSQLGRLFTARHGELCCEGALSMPQMMALRAIHEHGSVKVGDIAAALGVKAPAASALVDGLEKAGYVDRDHDPDDRRVSLLKLTSVGTYALGEAESERRHYMQRYTQVLTEEDITNLIRIHRKLIDAMLAERA